MKRSTGTMLGKAIATLAMVMLGGAPALAAGAGSSIAHDASRGYTAPTQAPIETLWFHQQIVLAMLITVLLLAAALGVYTLATLRRGERGRGS